MKKMLVFAIGILGFAWLVVNMVASPVSSREKNLPLKLYWNGYTDDGTSEESNDIPCIVEFIPKDGTKNEYPLNGYLIEGAINEMGVLATVINLAERSMDIVRYTNAGIETLVAGFAKPNLVRILAYKHGWVYYVSNNGIGDTPDYVYTRSNDAGEIQEYPKLDLAIYYMDPFIETVGFWTIEIPCAISDEGILAYCDDGFNYSVQSEGYDDVASYQFALSSDVIIALVFPDGKRETIGNGKHPVWVSGNQLLYEKERVLWTYDVAAQQSSEYRNRQGELIEVNIYRGEMAIDPSGMWISYFEHDTDGYYASIYQPICIVNIYTDQRYLSDPVMTRNRDWVAIRALAEP